MTDIERITSLEQRFAVTDERLKTMSTLIQSYSQLPLQFVTMQNTITSLSREITDIRRDFISYKDETKQERSLHNEERRSLRIALIGLTGVIIAAIIGGVFLLISKKSGG